MSKEIFDYFAAYPYLYAPDHIQRRVIDYLVGAQTPPEQFAALSAIKDPTAKVEMLALAQISVKSYAQSGDPSAKTKGIRDAIAGLKDNFQIRLDGDQASLGSLGLLPVIPCMNELPEWSFAIHLKFTLRQPYYSQDDSAFYLLDNPIRKEKVFRLPYIAPTQWKGTLHSVMVRRLATWWERKLNVPLSEIHAVSDKRQQAQWWREKLKEPVSESHLKEFVHQRTRLFRLFGTEKDFANENKTGQLYLDQLLPTSAGSWQASKYKLRSDSVGEWQAKKYHRFVSSHIASNGFLSGRLSFYPSFFTQIGLEVINPHSRKTGAGEVPILFETVPRDASADFLLLYVPHDCVGKPPDETAGQVAEDLQMIARGLREMFCLYGFGAKTSSGFGRAEETVEGNLIVRTKNDAVRQALREQPGTTEKQSAQPPLPKYLEAPDRLKPEYLNPDGTFIERTEAELRQFGKKDKQEYDKARRWWLTQQAEKDKVGEGDAESKQEGWPEAQFKSFSDLEKVTAGIAKALRQGDSA